MLFYITELSKYCITFLMILYCVECTIYLLKRNENKNYGIFLRQGIYMFAIQFLAYLTLCLRTGKIDYLFFYAILQILIFAMIILYHMIYPRVDRCLLGNMAMLLSICFIILTRLDFSKAVKQFGIVMASLIAAMIVPYFITHYQILKKGKWIYAATGILMLLGVLILGQVTHGSKIFYSIAGITFQPSEFIKIIFVFCIAAILYQSVSFSNVLLSGCIAAAHILILVVSKDLGSALVFFVGYLLMLFIASRNYIYLFLGIAAGSGGAVISYHVFRHVQVRVQAFLDPFTVIDKEGFQISQSLFAISCGSWFGTGLNKGIPSDIPYVESDFIFSAISEELGVIFAIGMLFVCICCFLIMMRNAMLVKDKFYRLVACGLGIMYIFQVFLTVGGGIKFIPLTGVTLPLVSYGGSSIMTSLIVFAVIQGIITLRKEENLPESSKHTKLYEEDEEDKEAMEYDDIEYEEEDDDDDEY